MARDNPLEGARKRAKTTTSAFGVSKREGHDSSVYYGSRMYDDLVSQRDVGETANLPDELANIVINGDSKSIPIPEMSSTFPTATAAYFPECVMLPLMP